MAKKAKKKVKATGKKEASKKTTKKVKTAKTAPKRRKVSGKVDSPEIVTLMLTSVDEERIAQALSQISSLCQLDREYVRGLIDGAPMAIPHRTVIWHRPLAEAARKALATVGVTVEIKSIVESGLPKELPHDESADE
jgi:hypothetical protein